MKVWMVWIQATDGHTWLEQAWTDDQVSENDRGWRLAVDTARNLAHADGNEVRIQAVTVPGVLELFAIPEVDAEAPS